MQSAYTTTTKEILSISVIHPAYCVRLWDNALDPDGFVMSASSVELRPDPFVSHENSSLNTVRTHLAHTFVVTTHNPVNIRITPARAVA